MIFRALGGWGRWEVGLGAVLSEGLLQVLASSAMTLLALAADAHRSPGLAKALGAGQHLG